jgi:hypothetical protein
MKKRNGRPGDRLRGILLAATASACLAPLSAAHASAKIPISDDSWVSVGLGIRASAAWDEHGAPDGSSDVDTSLDSVRLYINGQLNKTIGATFNTERDGDGDIKVLDGYVRFEFMDEFNVWAGRLLPPSDRSNLDGPYYLSSYNFPGLVSLYPARFAGRDDGVVVWGKLLDKKLVYSAGVFRGHNKISGASNEGGDPLFAGRVAYNFLDAEDNPGYYTSSTYYGSANVFTVGAAVQVQKNGVGTALTKGDYTAWNVDALFEKKLPGDGVVTLEGAYYNYDTDGVFDVGGGFGGAGSTDNVGGIVDGKAWLASAGYLFPQEIGIGKIQPVVRYQQFKADDFGYKLKQWDASLNYIIKGHNARVSLDYSHFDVSGGGGDNDAVTMGVQLQF